MKKLLFIGVVGFAFAAAATAQTTGPSTLERGVARPGGVYATLPGGDPSACARACANDGLCMSWSAYTDAQPRCELKAVIPHPVEDALAVSGLPSRSPTFARLVAPQSIGPPQVLAITPTSGPPRETAPPPESPAPAVTEIEALAAAPSPLEAPPAPDTRTDAPHASGAVGVVDSFAAAATPQTTSPSPLERGVARPGGVYATLAGGDPLACANACANDGLCMSWSAFTDAQPRCELKAVIPHPVENALAISGLSSRSQAFAQLVAPQSIGSFASSGVSAITPTSVPPRETVPPPEIAPLARTEIGAVAAAPPPLGAMPAPDAHTPAPPARGDVAPILLNTPPPELPLRPRTGQPEPALRLGGTP